MSVRRQNENILSIRKPGIITKKVGINENFKPSTLVTKPPQSVKSVKAEASQRQDRDSKPAKSIASRTALSSLTHNTPQQPRTLPRQPLTSKKPSSSSIKPPIKVAVVHPRTPGPTARKRVISIYTPAPPNRLQEEDSEDEIEYMPPRLAERPYEPPTPMRPVPGIDDELFAPDLPRQGFLDIPLELGEDEGEIIMSARTRSPYFPTGSDQDRLHLDDIPNDDFQLVL